MNEGALKELTYWSRMKKKKAGSKDWRHRLCLNENADPTTDRHTGQGGGKQQIDPGWLKQERDLWKG